MKYFALILAIISSTAYAESYHFEGRWLTFGPNFQYHFGGTNPGFGWGLEIGYWNLREQDDGSFEMSYGIDVGFENIQKQKYWYTEAQIGTPVIGVSMGPVFTKGSQGIDIGMQGSGWIGAFAYLDLRMREMKIGSMDYSPGLFLRGACMSPDEYY